MDMKRALQICTDIEADMKADATRFDGQPFIGKVVAEYVGNQGAAIAALARLMRELLGGADGSLDSPSPYDLSARDKKAEVRRG